VLRRISIKYLIVISIILIAISFTFTFKKSNPDIAIIDKSSFISRVDVEEKHKNIKPHTIHSQVNITEQKNDTDIPVETDYDENEEYSLDDDHEDGIEDLQSKPGDVVVVSFESGYPPAEYELDGINELIANNGSPFHGDVFTIRSIPPGTDVKLSLLDLKLEGVVTRNEIKNYDLATIRIDFNEIDQSISYMTLFYYLDGMVKGKIYSPEGNYVVEHNGEVGFILEMNELYRLEGSPKID